VETNNNEDDGSSSLDVLLRLNWPKPGVKTASIKKKRSVIVTGDSLLRGTGVCPVCRPIPLLREVCFGKRCEKKASYPGTALRLLSIIDFSGKQK